MRIAALNAAVAKRLVVALGYVVLVATIVGFMVYAASISAEAIFELEDVDHLGNAQHAFLMTGSLGLIVALGLLAVRH